MVYLQVKGNQIGIEDPGMIFMAEEKIVDSI